VSHSAVGVSLSFVLGAAFLVLQAVEYEEKLALFTWTTNAYGSLFYGITGFHGFHVLVGLLMMVFVLVGMAQGRYGTWRNQRVKLVAFYWHFVDAVWIFILSALYLSPHL
jgi:cytochrome c oxidase subunit 3